MEPKYPLKAVNETGDTTIDVQLLQVPDSAITAGSGTVSIATATGDVTGPSSAVNNNLAAFDGTTGKLLEDSGINTSQVATSQTAATAVARLALTGLARGARVYQTDTGFWYELTNAAAPDQATSWQAQPKVYKATLTQASTDPPVATPQENSLGQTLTPGYTSAGVFTLTAGGAVFTANQTRVFLGPPNRSDFTTEVMSAFSWDRTSTTVITIQTDNIDTLGAGNGPSNGLLTETAITIEVYPA